ncbi:MAG: hypothetical protein LBS83_03715 [Holosporales bacterium]|nr:hypothetical protein [Holosporales bacterium]
MGGICDFPKPHEDSSIEATNKFAEEIGFEGSHYFLNYFLLYFCFIILLYFFFFNFQFTCSKAP